MRIDVVAGTGQGVPDDAIVAGYRSALGPAARRPRLAIV
jgi:hypothetical protein